ncbi:Uncharacterised protein [Mycobacteroides abscessus subsp. abscessus]|nr:Uncharacterised protein [Mycobacteroides abscessus subsp. abscessus]
MNILISTYSCPNTRFIRTGRTGDCLLLSEYGVNSDRKNGKLPIVVRIRGRFGQEEREIAYCCPNTWSIRTGRTGNCLLLSEYVVDSDRKNGRLPIVVRIRGSFGQEEREIAYCCPNTGFIRTGRTGDYLLLSEYEGDSDRKNGKLPIVVRIRGSFKTGVF